MSQRTFDAFRQIVYNQCGISLGDSKVALVASRIAKRMRALKLSTQEAYLDYLKNDKDGDEMVQFLDTISTNVTSFFREDAHFSFMQEAMPKWYAQGQRRFRIWCAASSTGEEPVTISMVLNECLPSVSDAKVLATDISTRVLKIAQQGVYAEEKVKHIPPALRTKYFTHVKKEDGSPAWQVKPELHRMITWRRLNLSKPPFPMKGPLDIVFCRNVMIYFDLQVRRKLVGDIHRLLRPQGYLIVGAAETLAGIMDGYKLVQPSVYLKV